MRKYMLFLSLLAVVIACKNDPKEDKKTDDKSAPAEVVFSEVELDSSDFDNCKESYCPELDIQYIRFDETSAFAKQVNEINEKEIASVFHLDQDQPQEKNVKDALRNFIDEYGNFRRENTDSEAHYEAKLEQEVKDKNERTVVLKTDFYLYTGGAHGYGGVRFLNFDASTGKLLQAKDLVSDMQGFTDFVEHAFRQQYEIPEDANINSKGFFFEDDKFALPQNIAFTQDAVILIYNPYEAASYAEGQLRFMFPKKTVEKWLAY